MSEGDTDDASTPSDTKFDWRPYFGHEAPYENQRDAIESAIAAGRRGGYLAMEGPCGTGKTMAALTAGATLVREGGYERVLVVTPVKQQRAQFVEDLRRLNDGLDEPLRGVALVGKRDLCPYGREDVFPEDVGVQSRCDQLRENTAALVEGESGPPAATVELGGESDVWWDAEHASALAREARAEAGQAELGGALATAGAESPYQRAQPSSTDGATESLYCPFEADWYARNRGSPLGFEAGESGVVTADGYLPAATERGCCPHRVMGVLLDHAEVIVGNYNHLFDPTSRGLLAGLLDERTLVVVDEAHRLEERVRDLLSARLGTTTLRRARNDIETVLSRVRASDDAREAVETELAALEVPLEALDAARAFYHDLLEWVQDRVERALDERVPGWQRGEVPDRDIEVPLRDPETPERDELTRWAESEGYTGELWRSLSAVGTATEQALEALGEDRSAVTAPVGATLERWWSEGHERYLRELELEHAPADREGWQGTYTAGLVLFECMPGDSLAATFDELGGGVLMSATLEPLEVFTEVSGLDALEDRPVLERTYDLPFPPENRASFLVDATPFTSHNRGNPDDQADPAGWNQTRDEYAHVLRTLARSPGNVLLAMPNYREAEWAGSYLEDLLEKPVLVDASSSHEETEALKAEFFAGEGTVLVTSTRGTLTEGVDYDGEKLACCGVVGVPLVNIGSPRVQAVKRAYGDAFGESHAFEYALTVPAVRRARQALGRVIRGPEEVGVRALVGRRYAPDSRHSVHPYLSPGEREEFVRMSPEFLPDQLEAFWAERS